MAHKDRTSDQHPLAALVNGDDLLKSLIPNAPIVLFVLDREGTFLRSEGSGLEVLGLRPGEVTGLSVFELYRDFPPITDNIRRALAGESFTETVEVGQHHFNTRYEALRNGEGSVIGVAGLAIDITESKRTERALMQAVGELYAEKAKSEAIVAGMGDGICIQDRDFRITYQNRAHQEMIGNHIGEFCYQAYERGDRVCEGCPVALVYKDGRVHTVERSTEVDGKTLHAEITASPLRDARGNIVAGIEIVRNVTSKKQMEEALRASEERYRLFAQNLQGISYQVDCGASTLTFMHGSVEEITGYRSEDLTSGRIVWPQIVHPDDLPFFLEESHKLAKAAGFVADTEYRVRRKDGTFRWVRDICRSVYDQERKTMYLHGVVHDISEKRAVEEALAGEKEFSDATINSLPGIFYVLDEQGRLVKWNENLEKVTRYASSELFHMNGLDLVAEEVRTTVGEKIRQGFTDGHVTAETLVLTKHGRAIPYYVTGTRLSMSDGAYLIGVGIDVSEQEKAERDLRIREAELSALLNAIPDMMFKIARDGIYLDFKAAKDFEPLIPPKEFLGRSLHETMPPDLARKATYHIERALLMNSVEIFDYQLTVAGAARQYEARVVPVNKEEVLAIIRDITDHRLLEAQLRHAQKMEAIGTLTGGVAHEFNNILTSLLGYGELLQAGLSREDPLRGHVERIVSSAERAAKLTRGLLAYSRKEVSYMEPIDLNRITKMMEEFLLKLVGEHIELKILSSDTPLVVMADRSQIEQVLMNLATNAIDAMPTGGTITIRLERRRHDTLPEFRKHGIKPGDYAVIIVEDTGHGISDDIQSKVFEPFFTTKDVGKGTGLGLSMVYGLMQKHNGSIFFTSSPGKGTTFFVCLPLAGRPERAAEEVVAKTHAFTGERTVLLAEDEPIVREIMRSVLEREGFRVLEAVDGVDAVEQYRKEGGAVDLLLFDVAMPKKNGQAAYEEICKINPGIKVIFTSGYLPEDVRTQSVVSERFPLLQKPVRSEELLKMIRQVFS